MRSHSDIIMINNNININNSSSIGIMISSNIIHSDSISSSIGISISISVACPARSGALSIRQTASNGRHLHARDSFKLREASLVAW